jgi:CHAT domain-containing protein
LAIAREVKNRHAEQSALNHLGDAARSFRRVDEAVSYHEQALLIAREIKSQDQEASALDSLMLDWKARRQPPLATYFGKQAVNVYQEIRGNIRSLDAESQRSFLKSKEETYRTLADLLIAQGRLPEAEQVIRMLKEEEYFEFIRRDQSNAPQADKAQLTAEEQALEKRYREIADRIAELGTERGALIDKKNRTAEEEQRLARLDADLVVAGAAFQKFLSRLETELGASRDASSRAYALRESQGLMQDLRELGPGTVALYTLITDDKYRVILTTPDFQKGYEYSIKAADLNRKVLELREVLQRPRYDPLPLSQELYRILLGPVARDLEKAKARTLMWSLDGVLRYVPVAALHDGKRYLVERFDNVVFTPASQARLKDAPARNWDALGLGVSKAHGERIPALPGVLDEMRGIIRDESVNNTMPADSRTGVLPGVVKLDEQFTQEAMLSELRKRHKVVHIASHFQFSPGNETNSALLLGDGSFLSLAQIKSLPNVFGGVELLTLSACNTATSGGADGKEVEGFGVLAQRQGAKAVVASLWPVAERSTKVLMQEFYRAREARAGLTKVAALREAQLKLLRGEVAVDVTTSAGRQIIHEDAKPGADGRPVFKPDSKAPFAHPYYWAPFILIASQATASTGT